MQEIDVSALVQLKACRNLLTWQQYKTLRGQVLSGDAAGAVKGLQNILRRIGKQEKNAGGYVYGG